MCGGSLAFWQAKLLENEWRCILVEVDIGPGSLFDKEIICSSPFCCSSIVHNLVCLVLKL